MRLFPALPTGARVVEQCPVCSSGRIEYAFTVDGRHMARCLACTMLFLREPANAPADHAASLDRARKQVAFLVAQVVPVPQRVLVVLPPDVRGAIAGCDVLGADEVAGTRPPEPWDAVVCVDAIDRVADPGAFLDALRACVAAGAPALFTQLSVDSAAARFAGAAWWGFHSGASAFFGVDTLQNLLVRHGFRHPQTYADGVLRQGSLRVRTASRVLAGLGLREAATSAQRKIGLLDESFTLLCRRDEPIARYRLSVIVPVYNERATFRELMDRLVAKSIDDVDIEIIIVESNSTDGSRDAVLAFESHPRVRIILQPAPQGKGNAVRAGLAVATGDIVLFQDADLEYEVEDYDDLLRPIRSYERNFVIGSRHGREGSNWKIRDFNDAPVLSQMFNLGHVFFLQLLNTIYDQRMADPFSMFKVFRRDCLAGLTFECNRFDFDFEIVIKLLRKGYKPLELPVNYQSRSIAEGKKVTMVRDPLTWLRALVRFRSGDLYGKNSPE